MGSMISSLVSGLVSPVVGYFQKKQELASVNHENDLAAAKAQGERQVQLIAQGLAADANGEADSLKAGQQYRGFELFVVSVPAVMVFVPGCAAYVKQGFLALASTPGWYQTLLITIFLANYGIRLWRRNTSDT
jgi:hypothetical protein